MESLGNEPRVNQGLRRIGLALCVGVLLGSAMQRLLADLPNYARIFAPDWLPLGAAGFAAAGLMVHDRSPWSSRLQTGIRWIGLLLMVWAANGLPFDWLRVAGLIPGGVDWPGLATRTMALAAVVVLVYLMLQGSSGSESARAAWYGYAAFGLALPYPILRLHWAFGGTLGLLWPGAAGQGFAPLLITIPFVMAAILSLLLVSPRRWMPRWALLAAGWAATALLGMVGPAGTWAFVSMLANGGGADNGGIEIWVFGLFYASWFLWAIAAAAATRSYQLRSAALQMSSPA